MNVEDQGQNQSSELFYGVKHLCSSFKVYSSGYWCVCVVERVREQQGRSEGKVSCEVNI